MPVVSERGMQILGWLLFVASAVAFTVQSVRAHDLLGLIGSLLFLLACLVFLAPLLRRPKASRAPSSARAKGRGRARAR